MGQALAHTTTGDFDVGFGRQPSEPQRAPAEGRAPVTSDPETRRMLGLILHALDRLPE